MKRSTPACAGKEFGHSRDLCPSKRDIDSCVTDAALAAVMRTASVT